MHTSAQSASSSLVRFQIWFLVLAHMFMYLCAYVCSQVSARMCA